MLQIWSFFLEGGDPKTSGHPPSLLSQILEAHLKTLESTQYTRAHEVSKTVCPTCVFWFW